jgi:hypothetical protein
MKFFDLSKNPLFIDYRILKSPLEVIKPNEHKMQWFEYKIVLKHLATNMSEILKVYDETPNKTERYLRLGYQYIDTDYEMRHILFKKYEEVYREIRDAFVEGKIVCSYKDINNDKVKNSIIKYISPDKDKIDKLNNEIPKLMEDTDILWKIILSLKK